MRSDSPVPTGIDRGRPISIDLRPPTGDIGEVGAALDILTSELRRLWSSALEQGDFDEVTRLVEASHAVHRAAIALKTEGVIASRSWSA